MKLGNMPTATIVLMHNNHNVGLIWSAERKGLVELGKLRGVMQYG